MQAAQSSAQARSSSTDATSAQSSTSAANQSSRAAELSQHVRGLNEQFLQWAKLQWQQKSARFWSHGMLDYLRHTAIMRRDYADVIAAENGEVNGETKRKALGPQINILPLRQTKTVHLVRHGEAWHNVGVLNRDAALTPFGWAQAHALHGHIAALPQPLELQLIVVSPLRRTLETAAAAFGAGPWTGGPRQPLMQAQAAQDTARAQQQALAAPDVPIIAVEGCRERLGSEPCDMRSSISDIRRDFPAVDFSQIEHDADLVWERYRGEVEHQVQARGKAFLQWLMARPETNIAVVSHCGFLFYLLSSFGHDCSPHVAASIHRPMDNAEMRSFTITDAAGPPRQDGLWFPGGRAWLTSAGGPQSHP